MGSKQKNLEKRKESLILPIAILAILVMGIIIFSAWRINQNIGNIPAEIARSMTYEQVQEGENIVEQTGEHVTFDAFFLRDLDGDGYAEALRGACRQIGKQDTLYMELNVLTEGSLKDGKIQINGQNFYLQTALPKDNELKSSYIGANIKEIELNEIKK